MRDLDEAEAVELATSAAAAHFEAEDNGAGVLLLLLWWLLLSLLLLLLPFDPTANVVLLEETFGLLPVDDGDDLLWPLVEAAAAAPAAALLSVAR